MAITDVGTNQTFNYTGGIQTFTAPFSGTYKLEVYGAQGGTATYTAANKTGTGGKGGYSYGSINLTAGDKLYVCVGGQGAGTDGATTTKTAAGGYNGGGNGFAQAVYDGTSSGAAAGGGGGATHIGKTNTTLANTSSTNVLIVAGGGGGGAIGQLASACTGGSGGGSATAGTKADYSGNVGVAGAVNGGSYGAGQSCTASITTGQCSAGGGGGGGYKGGGCGYSQQYAAGGSGAGGTGYVGGVTSGTTSNGQRTGNGQAIITLTKISTLFYYNDVAIDKLIFNGTTITSLIFNGTKIF